MVSFAGCGTLSPGYRDGDAPPFVRPRGIPHLDGGEDTTPSPDKEKKVRVTYTGLLAKKYDILNDYTTLKISHCLNDRSGVIIIEHACVEGVSLVLKSLREYRVSASNRRFAFSSLLLLSK